MTVFIVRFFKYWVTSWRARTSAISHITVFAASWAEEAAGLEAWDLLLNLPATPIRVRTSFQAHICRSCKIMQHIMMLPGITPRSCDMGTGASQIHI